MKPRLRLSTVCLLVWVLALHIALLLLTARHNAQLWDMTARFNAQLAEQTERHNAQLVKQAEEFNLQLKDLSAKHTAKPDE